MPLKLPTLQLLLLFISPFLVAATSEAAERPLSKEPFLLELFQDASKAKQLAQLTSCLDSVFKLNQAYEALFGFKSIYNDYLSNKTDTLSEFENQLLQFCREPTPVKTATDRFWHPVSAHQFVAFVAREINPKLHRLIKEDSRVKILLQHLLSSAECWLNEKSVQESFHNLLVIKSFYNISVQDFASGNFFGMKSETELSTAELMELLLHLNRQFDPLQTAELGKFDKAIEALTEYKASIAPSGADMRGVDADLAYISANRRGEPADFALESSRSASSLERDFGIVSNAATAATSSASVLTESREKFQRYRRLCNPYRRGILEPDDDEVAARAATISASPLLICEFWRPYNGWYPIRKEILSRSPFIVRYSDVFTNASQAESLLLEAENRIFEAPKEKDMAKNEINRLTQVRVHSFKKPVLPFDSNASKAIIGRVEFVTRLDATAHFVSQEKFIEVFNYGHGISNKPHLAPKLPDLFYNGLAEAIIFEVMLEYWMPGATLSRRRSVSRSWTTLIRPKPAATNSTNNVTTVNGTNSIETSHVDATKEAGNVTDKAVQDSTVPLEEQSKSQQNSTAESIKKEAALNESSSVVESNDADETDDSDSGEEDYE
uniref:Tudor domain-containing protein n=1 Tax=Macrostomum lignano TaxID=282301 RepID=A0A1I8GUA4_9PLAT